MKRILLFLILNLAPTLYGMDSFNHFIDAEQMHGLNVKAILENWENLPEDRHEFVVSIMTLIELSSTYDRADVSHIKFNRDLIPEYKEAIKNSYHDFTDDHFHHMVRIPELVLKVVKLETIEECLKKDEKHKYENIEHRAQLIRKCAGELDTVTTDIILYAKIQSEIRQMKSEKYNLKRDLEKLKLKIEQKEAYLKGKEKDIKPLKKKILKQCPCLGEEELDNFEWKPEATKILVPVLNLVKACNCNCHRTENEQNEFLKKSAATI